jgi:hypothetical protein
MRISISAGRWSWSSFAIVRLGSDVPCARPTSTSSIVNTPLRSNCSRLMPCESHSSPPFKDRLGSNDQPSHHTFALLRPASPRAHAIRCSSGCAGSGTGITLDGLSRYASLGSLDLYLKPPFIVPAATGWSAANGSTRSAARIAAASVTPRPTARRSRSGSSTASSRPSRLDGRANATAPSAESRFARSERTMASSWSA